MFSKVFLASLFVVAAVAAPAPSVSDGATPSIIQLNSNVSCTNANSAGIPPAPSPSVILLNNPSPQQPTTSAASDPYAGYGAAQPQPSGTSPFANLNAPAATPPVIKLNRRQFGSASAASTFSFGGIIPSSTVPLSSPITPTISPASSFSFGSIPTPPPASASSGVPNGISVFTSTGTNGIETVFMLATVTVTPTGFACASSPVFNPVSTSILSPAPSSNPPFSPLASPAPSLSPSGSASSFLGVNVQTSAGPSTTPLSSPGTINLNTPPAAIASDTGFSFSSAPAPSITPAPFPVQSAAPTSCDLACQLTATV